MCILPINYGSALNDHRMCKINKERIRKNLQIVSPMNADAHKFHLLLLGKNGGKDAVVVVFTGNGDIIKTGFCAQAFQPCSLPVKPKTSRVIPFFGNTTGFKTSILP